MPASPPQTAEQWLRMFRAEERQLTADYFMVSKGSAILARIVVVRGYIAATEEYGMTWMPDSWTRR